MGPQHTQTRSQAETQSERASDLASKPSLGQFTKRPQINQLGSRSTKIRPPNDETNWIRHLAPSLLSSSVESCRIGAHRFTSMQTSKLIHSSDSAVQVSTVDWLDDVLSYKWVAFVSIGGLDCQPTQRDRTRSDQVEAKRQIAHGLRSARLVNWRHPRIGPQFYHWPLICLLARDRWFSLGPLVVACSLQLATNANAPKHALAGARDSSESDREREREGKSIRWRFL